MYNRSSVVRGLLIAGILLALWLLLTDCLKVSPLVLPRFESVLMALVTSVRRGELPRDIGFTMGRVFVASCFGLAAGCAVGVLMLLLPKLTRWILSSADFLRSIPVIALYPAFVLVMGVGPHVLVFSAAWISGLIVLVEIAQGIRHARVGRLEFYRSIGLTRRELIQYVYLPEVLPFFLGGARVAISMAFAVVVALEMLTTPGHGLGHRIYESSQLFRVPLLYGCIAVVGLLGFGVNVAIHQVELRCLHWRGR